LFNLCGEDKVVRLWNPANGHLIAALNRYGPTVGAMFSPNGRALAVIASERVAWLWDPANGEPIAALNNLTPWSRQMVFSPDGGILATVGEDHIVRLWRTPDS
jgi:WD40 repeat protein